MTSYVNGKCGESARVELLAQSVSPSELGMVRKVSSKETERLFAVRAVFSGSHRAVWACTASALLTQLSHP